MKRLITILTLVALISGISVAAFGAVTEDVVVRWEVGRWITLYIPPADQNVELAPDWLVEEGGGAPIFRTVGGPFNVSVWTSLQGGFVLTVRAGRSLPRRVPVAEWFDIQGGDLGTTWHSLEMPRILLSSNAAGTFWAHNIDYQFRFDPAYHPPGDYTLTIIYTATAR